MEEIKVGEYVRTKNGKIRKLKSTVAQYYILEKVKWNDEVQYELKNFTKHSPNIIDLIEVGDYVNGDYVVKVYTYKNGNVQCIEVGELQQELKNKDIKSIVTHERFDSIKYEVI